METHRAGFMCGILAAVLAISPQVLFAQDIGDELDDIQDSISDSVGNISASMSELAESESNWIASSPAGTFAEDLNLGGWIEQGFTWNPDSPRNRQNNPVLFNDRANEFQLNQLYLYLEKPVEHNGCDWDFGGRIDVVFGSDFRFITVPGLEEHDNGTRRWNDRQPRFYGFAMPQMYAEIASPNGVSIKLGHFYSTMGVERFAAPDNFFYSHSYTYIFGSPFTFSGALVSMDISDSLTAHGAITTGWDNWEHPARHVGFLGGVKWTSDTELTSLAVTVTTGKDLTVFTNAGNPIVRERVKYSLVASHQFTDRLRYILQHDFGDQQSGAIDVVVAPPTINFADAQWYGVNQYFIYDVNDELSAGLRFEWFSDQNSSRIQIPISFVPGGNTFTGNDYYALTAGLNWRPHERVTIRPELRWDWSDVRGNPNVPGGNAAFRAYNDGTSGSQITIGSDVIITF